MSVAEGVGKLLPAASRGVVESHLRRFPPRYQECFSARDMALHVRLLAELDARDPVRLVVGPLTEGGTECTVLAFDHPALFSLISGILASHGLEVLSGDAFTSAIPPGSPGSAISPGSPGSAISPGSPGSAISPGSPGSARGPGAPPTGARRRRHRRQAHATSPERRQIIDRFRGSVRTELELSRWAEQAEAALRAVLLLFEEGTDESFLRARERVNDMVAEALASLHVDVTKGLYPVQIEIDNEREGATVLAVDSEDTPFFLYAFSSALALRHLSVEQVRIRTEADRIHDEFGIVDARGLKVRDAALLDQVRLSALLTKQFCYFLGNSPDPTAALARFQELVERVFPVAERERWIEYLSDPRTLEDLARLLGASDFLWEDFVRLQYEAILPIVAPARAGAAVSLPVEGLAERLRSALDAAASYDGKVDALNRFKDAEVFAYDLDHILDPASGHAELGRRLTRLAECVVGAAVELAVGGLTGRHGVPRTVAGLAVPYAVTGLGKLGGEALGYASDIELMLVYQDSGSTDGEERIENGEFFSRVAREVARVIRTKREGIFRVDLRLRPYGSSGQAACSLESFCRYYARDGDAHSYERLALVSMRAIGGDPDFGARVERVRDEMLFVSGSIDLGELRGLRARQAREKDAIRRSNAKFSPGALVDLEYTVQILQVKYGGENVRLRTPKTREALSALRDAGVLETAEAERLSAAYGFLRGLINALRMLRGSALDLYLPDPGSEEYVHLARRMGYRAGLDPARQLHVDFEAQTAEIRSFMQRQFGSQSLLAGEIGSCADLVLSDEVPAPLRERILRSAGLRDFTRGYTNLRRLAGSGRSKQVFARLAVLAADMLPRKPDADMALNNWERFMSRVEQSSEAYERLLSQPTRLDILLSIFASSQYLSDTLVAYPAFFEWLAEPVTTGRIREREEIARDLDSFWGDATSPQELSTALRVFKRRELARIGAKDICLGARLEEVCFEISELADALLGRVLERIASEQPGEGRPRMVILAFGKLGGRELNYSSDIDLVGVYDDPDLGAGQACGRLLEGMRRELGSHTEAGYAYRVDFRLRPYGSSGELAPSRRALVSYYERTASLWELQAALKTRAVAGDRALGEALVRSLREIVVGRVDAIVREPAGRARLMAGIRDLRGASARSRGRLARLSVDVKNDPGGIRDVELLVQGLELLSCARHPELLEGNTLRALDLVERAGLLESEAAQRLREGYVFLRKVEHYLQIFDDRQTHTLPVEGSRLEHLARCLLGRGVSRGAFFERLERTRSHVQAELERFLAAG